MRPGKNGGRLLRGGKPGNKGGPGGHNSLARQIRIGAIADAFLNVAPTVAADPSHKDFAKVGTWAVEMKEGRPKQAVEGGDKPLELVIKVVEE